MHIQVNCPQFSLFISHLKSNQEDIWISFFPCPFHNIIVSSFFSLKEKNDDTFFMISWVAAGGV